MAEEESNDQEKTEEPSPRKLQQARDKGEVAKSKEVPAAFTMAAVMLFAYTLGQSFFMAAGKMFVFFFNNLLQGDMTIHTIMKLCNLALEGLLPLIVAIFAMLLFSAVAGNIAVVGFIFSTESLKIDFSRIKPLQKLQQMFMSKDSLVELAKNLLKLTIFLFITFSVIMKYSHEILALGKLTSIASMVVVGRMFLEILRNAVIFYLVIGIVDWMYQKYSFKEKMKMTKQELKDEHKNMEGDPKFKFKRRQKGRDMIFGNGGIQEVQGADVVITNPTHYAIAIKYDDTRMNAPVVVAKGADFMALQMRKIARKNRVEIYEAPPLARFLYATVEVGHEIPEEVYKAVAEILIYVYQLKGKMPVQQSAQKPQ